MIFKEGDNRPGKDLLIGAWDLLPGAKTVFVPKTGEKFPHGVWGLKKSIKDPEFGELMIRLIEQVDRKWLYPDVKVDPPEGRVVPFLTTWIFNPNYSIGKPNYDSVRAKLNLNISNDAFFLFGTLHEGSPSELVEAPSPKVFLYDKVADRFFSLNRNHDQEDSEELIMQGQYFPNDQRFAEGLKVAVVRGYEIEDEWHGIMKIGHLTLPDILAIVEKTF